MCKILIPPESKAGFIIMGAAHFHGWETNLLYSSLMLSHQEQFTDLLCKERRNKFSHSLLLPHNEEKVNIINYISNNVGLNSNKKD